jgi:hypothetical protein
MAPPQQMPPVAPPPWLFPVPQAASRDTDTQGMPAYDPFRVPLSFAATHGDAKEARALRRGHERGEIHRVRRGVYVAMVAWTALDDRGRHVVAVRAALAGHPARLVASHESAVAVHDLPRVHRAFGDVVQLIDPLRAEARRARLVHVRPGDLPLQDTVDVEGLPTTSLSRTAVDVAKCSAFGDAVLCIDAVLRRIVLRGRHDTGAHVDERLGRVRAELLAAVGPGDRRGGSAAARAIEFASPWAENGGESLARITLHELGVEVPVLQKVVTVHGRFAGRGDMHLPDDGALLEFDGMEKFVDGDMLAGRSTAEALRRMKARDRELLRSSEVRTIVHFDLLDVVHPARLADLLAAAHVAVDPRRVRTAARLAAVRFARPDVPA